MKKRVLVLYLICLVCFAAVGCMRSTARQAVDEKAANAVPKLPEDIAVVDGVPQISVYSVDSESIETMDLETYVQGVLAGEMRNDWPEEALKAQAILARTFVLNFISEKDSRYAGADISTDIGEAQAYDASNINERIRDAAKQTEGLVMVYDGRFPYAWFHAHAGGITELPTAALEYKKADPPYTQVIESPDSEQAPENVQHWSASFTADEVAEACAETGVKTGKVTSLEIGKQGDSGRAITFIVNGKEVSAPALRLRLGGTQFKSTLLESIEVKGDTITFSGRGYGHGVGMSQWGAYGMAEEGANAQEIVQHYFKGVSIEKLY